MDSEQSPGVIQPGCLYSAAEVRQRLRISAKTWKQLRDAGLPVRYIGRQAFVSSDDLIEALRPQREAITV